ncbi:BTB POZ domain-containing 6-like [Paramuricea clavata]|uniref:BTB POZ domain-containing 6-like n=1 Tax=Paramuricea clavata TaxID=317549 RepID=A0A6S7GIY2_PARCT|nr:BTB POZ domain-containing 6-like [Paramuricea clavata]
MASKYHDNWQSSKKTVLQRNAYMFDNELMSDVSFTCGESSRIFRAHKYMLATSSTVFYAMFYGDLAHKEFPICIPDAEKESFKEFLRFLYTDDCEITNAEKAIGVLYLANKYLISSLAEKCCKVLKTSIKPDNVFVVLEQAVKLFDMKNELEAKCWDIISKKTRECINSAAFCNIASDTLNSLLKKETLAITEVELFKGVLRWIDSECTRQGINIEEDQTARRQVLGDSVYEIRFLEISQENFENFVFSTGILTATEITCIREKLDGEDVADLKWKEHEKWRFTVIFSRFDPANVDDEFWKKDYNGTDSDAVAFTVNKAAFFHGVRLFGFCGSQYEVNFTIKDKDRDVKGCYISEEDSDGVSGYDVMLPKPIPLLPNEEITIIATIRGPESLRGWNGSTSVTVDDTVITFKDAPSGLSRNGTTKSQGQFYSIFLSELYTYSNITN